MERAGGQLRRRTQAAGGGRGNVPALLTAGLAAWIAAAVGLTVATSERALSVGALASSPRRIGEGRLWLLVSNALLVQRPVAVSLLAFALLAGAALAVCGPRLAWLAALTGHVCSTLLAYSLLVCVQLVHPGYGRTLETAPDYGVSAVSAAWLGALAERGWRRRARTPRGKAAVVGAVVAVALFAWMLRRTVDVIDADHVFAFAIGVLVAGLRERTAAPSGRRRTRRRGAMAAQGR